MDGTEIDWKPKKNLCSEETRKKQKGGNKGGKKGGQVSDINRQIFDVYCCGVATTWSCHDLY